MLECNVFTTSLIFEFLGFVSLVMTCEWNRCFLGVDFFGALRARVYDDEVRKWVSGIGVEKIGKSLVNSKEGPPTFKKPAMTKDKLMQYGFLLLEEQENVKRVQLANTYLSSAALGDANADAIKQGTF